MRRIQWLTGALLTVALVIASLGGPQQGSAQPATPEAEDPEIIAQFLFRPLDQPDGSYIEVNLAAGETQQFTVIAANQHDEPIALRTYSTDAYTLVNGGFGLREELPEPSAPTTWLDYATETIDFAPGQSIERTFSVTVPEETPPGQYVTGLVLQTAEPLEVPGTALFQQIIRKVIPVSIIVPGPIEAGADIGDPSIELTGGVRALDFSILNTGNYRLRPEGTLALTESNGRETLTSPIQMGSVYPGHETVIRVGIPQQLPAGDYTIDMELIDPDTGWSTTVTDAPITIPPPELPASELAPVEITNVTIAPVPPADSGDPPQYAALDIEITNRSVAVPAAQLTLLVARDGEMVEEFVLSRSLALLEVDTTIEQRYIPADGWQEGVYTFALLLESVDPTTGTETILASTEIADPIVVEGS